MTRRLYLMRHGETLFNRQQRVQGFSDSPLTERGAEQGRRAGLLLASLGIRPDYFCCSTSERASDTLEYCMQGLFGEVRPYDRYKGLKEFNRGVFEGEPLYLMPKDHAVRNTYFLPFGGESDDASLERLSATLTQVMLADGHKTVLAVSHGGVCHLFMDRVREGGANERIGNCSIMVYDFEPDQADTSVPGAGFTYREMILPEAVEGWSW